MCLQSTYDVREWLCDYSVGVMLWSGCVYSVGVVLGSGCVFTV